MIAKTITYQDYDGNKRTETFHFNLSKAELMEMNLSHAGGFDKTIQRIIEAQDTKQILALFKDIIRQSYGEKTPDGRQFMKSPERSQAFEQTEAYSELFMELIQNDTSASAFINGVIPQGLAEEAAAAKNDSGLTRIPDKTSNVDPLSLRGQSKPFPTDR